MLSTTSVQISGAFVPIWNNIVKIHKTADLRKTCDFTVVDNSGALSFMKRQPVIVTDSLIGVRFKGYIHTAVKSQAIPGSNPDNLIDIQCVDQTDIANNQYVRHDYQMQYGGDIFADLVANYLTGEGVSANAATRRDSTTAQWNLGTLTNTVGVNHVDDGNLELKPAGTDYSLLETTTSDFTTGATLNNVTVSNGTVKATAIPGLQFTGTMTIPGTSSGFASYKIWNGSRTVLADDYIQYIMWIDPSSPEIKAGVDLTFSDGSTFNIVNVQTDEHDLGSAVTTDMAGFASGKWYARSFPVGGAFTGKVITSANLVFGGTKGGKYIAYFRDIQIWNDLSSTIVVHMFDTTQSIPNASQEIVAVGYNNLSVTTVSVYALYTATTGTIVTPFIQPQFIGQNPAIISNFRRSPSYSIATPVLAGQSFISWDATVPANTYMSIRYSLNGAGPIECINNAPLPGLVPGMNLAGQSIVFFQNFNRLDGALPTDCPTLNSLSLTIKSAPACTKTDLIYTTAFSAGETGATFNNTVTNTNFSNSLQLIGATRYWDDANDSNRTAYLVGSAFAQMSLNQFVIANVIMANEAKVRNDFAGQLQNFVLDCDIQVPTADVMQQNGIFYRSTNLSTSSGSYAYAVFVSTTAVTVRRGTNTTGGGATTALSTYTIALTAGSWVHITIVCIGSSQSVYLNGTSVAALTSTTFPNAGYTGFVCNTANVSANDTVRYDNFGVMPDYNGTWISPTKSLASLGTYQTSFIYWRDRSESPNASNSILVQYSLNGGSSFFTAVNGGKLTALTKGTSLASVNLVLKVTLLTSTASRMPMIEYLGVIIEGGYSSTGTRISPALDLNLITQPGQTQLVWNGNLPTTDTTMNIYTSPDAVTTTLAGTTASGATTISTIASSADPFDDTYDVDDHALYTSSSKSGGATGTWTFNTPWSRLEVVGGTEAQYVIAQSTPGGTYTVDTDYSDGGGIIWRRQSNANYYKLDIFDSASSSGLQNKLRLVKVVSNSTTTLMTVNVTLTRGNVYRIKVSMIGSAITVTVDGTTVISTTDTSLTGIGLFGLSNVSGSARFYRFRVRKIQVSLAGQKIYAHVQMTTTDPLYSPQMYDLTMGVKATGIENGLLIPQTQYSLLAGNNVTVAQAFDDLAKRSGFVWDIDNSLNSFFRHRSSSLTPWVFTPNDMLSKVKITADTSSDSYENTHIINGGIDTVIFTETKTGDGITQSWNTLYPIQSIDSLSVNGVTYTFGVRSVDTGRDFYYKPGESSFSQSTSATPLASVQVITLKYEGIANVVVEMRNDSQIATIAALDGTNGIIEKAETCDGLGKYAMIQLCQSRLDLNAVLSIIFIFATTREGINPATIASLFYSPFAINDLQLLVTDVETSINSINVEHTVTMTSGPVLGDWVQKAIERGV